jgi:hypothetical protein
MSPNEETVADYFEALNVRDYRTARVCLIHLMRDTSNLTVIEDLIRRTYEMAP